MEILFHITPYVKVALHLEKQPAEDDSILLVMYVCSTILTLKQNKTAQTDIKPHLQIRKQNSALSW